MISNLGDLKYVGGYPTAETIRELYDQLDMQRAAQAYLDFMPAMSLQAVLDAHLRDYGVSETGGMIVYVEPGEGKSIAVGLTVRRGCIRAERCQRVVQGERLHSRAGHPFLRAVGPDGPA